MGAVTHPRLHSASLVGDLLRAYSMRRGNDSMQCDPASVGMTACHKPEPRSGMHSTQLKACIKRCSPMWAPAQAACERFVLVPVVGNRGNS